MLETLNDKPSNIEPMQFFSPEATPSHILLLGREVHVPSSHKPELRIRMEIDMIRILEKKMDPVPTLKKNLIPCPFCKP